MYPVWRSASSGANPDRPIAGADQRRYTMPDIIDKRYKANMRYAADLRTALEVVVSAYNSDTNGKREMEWAMEYADNVLYDLYHAEKENTDE